MVPCSGPTGHGSGSQDGPKLTMDLARKDRVLGRVTVHPLLHLKKVQRYNLKLLVVGRARVDGHDQSQREKMCFSWRRIVGWAVAGRGYGFGCEDGI